MLMDKEVKSYLRTELIIGAFIMGLVSGSAMANPDSIFPVLVFVYPWLFLGTLLWGWPTADIEEEDEFDYEKEERSAPSV